MIPVPTHILETLCAAFSIDPRWLAYLGGGKEFSDGILYAYPHQNGSRIIKIGVLKESDAGGFLRIEERLKFVHFLGEHGVNIVFPITNADGKPPTERSSADAAGRGAGGKPPLDAAERGADGSLLASAREGENIFVAYIMEKCGGSHPKIETWDAGLTRSLGQTIGRLHRITQIYPTGDCEVLDPVTGKPILGWEQEWEDFYNWCQDKAVKRHWLVMRERLAALPISRDSFGFIHNDPHHQNILVSGQKIILLDFDVANYHWFITDISIAMQGLLFSQNGGMDHPLVDARPLREFLDAFMQGYETENHLDPFWLGKLDLLIEYRRMLLFTVMQNWLGKKPTLRASWKKMILEEPPLLGG